MAPHIFKHAGNIYDQQKVNRRLTVMLVSMFILYYLVLGYGADVIILENDPLGIINKADGSIPYMTIIAFLFAVAYTLFCLYRGDDLILKSIKNDPLWSVNEEEQIVQRIWHDDKMHSQLVSVVNEMSIAAGIPMPAIHLVADSDPNALATGMDPAHASVAVTSGLLKRLDREQLQAVIAHAMAHIRNYDTRLMTLVSTLGTGSIILAAATGTALSGGGGGGSGKRDGGGAGVIGLFGSIVAFLPFWLGLAMFTALTVRALELLISDERVFQADVTASELTRNPSGVMRALQELESWMGPTRSFSPAISSLCIMGPSGEYKRMDNPGFAFRFCLKSHPSMARRIEAVKELGFLQGPRPVQERKEEENPFA